MTDRSPTPKFALALLFALVALVPAGAFAHARWFVDEEDAPPTDWSALLSWPVLLALLSGVGVVAALAWLQRRLGDPLWPRPPFFQRLEPAAPAILGVQTAIAIIFAATRLQLFVPNIDLPRDVFGVAVAGVAIVSAFSFITGVYTRLGALVTVALVVLAFSFAPWEEVIEQLLFVGIALYLVAVGRGVVRYGEKAEDDRLPLTDRLQPHALTILRLCAGLSVVVLAFTEKLLNVELSVAFLERYPDFNVVRTVGFAGMSDRTFSLLAGIVEATAGFALIAGYLPRLVILGLWIPFNLGIAFLPPQELIGHLPILATMYVLLVRGTEGVPAPEGTENRLASPLSREAGEGLGVRVVSPDP